jgi:hypothetical protein
MKGNPIAFNPDTMTVRQLKDCAELLRLLFDGIEREVDDDNIIHHLAIARERWQKDWCK